MKFETRKLNVNLETYIVGGGLFVISESVSRKINI